MKKRSKHLPKHTFSPFKKGDSVVLKKTAFTQLYLKDWGITSDNVYSVHNVYDSIIYIMNDHDKEMGFHFEHFEGVAEKKA